MTSLIYTSEEWWNQERLSTLHALTFQLQEVLSPSPGKSYQFCLESWKLEWKSWPMSLWLSLHPTTTTPVYDILLSTPLCNEVATQCLSVRYIFCFQTCASLSHWFLKLLQFHLHIFLFFSFQLLAHILFPENIFSSFSFCVFAPLLILWMHYGNLTMEFRFCIHPSFAPFSCLQPNLQHHWLDGSTFHVPSLHFFSCQSALLLFALKDFATLLSSKTDLYTFLNCHLTNFVSSEMSIIHSGTVHISCCAYLEHPHSQHGQLNAIFFNGLISSSDKIHLNPQVVCSFCYLKQPPDETFENGLYQIFTKVMTILRSFLYTWQVQFRSSHSALNATPLALQDALMTSTYGWHLKCRASPFSCLLLSSLFYSFVLQIFPLFVACRRIPFLPP